MVELAAQLSFHRVPHDPGRLIDVDDMPYRVFLRAELERVKQMIREANERAKNESG